MNTPSRASIGRPRANDPRRFLTSARSWSPAILVGATVLAVTGLAFLAAERAEERRVVNGLELRVDWRANDIQGKIDGTREALVATAVHVAAQPSVDAAAFERFATAVHKSGKPIAALEWVPLVARDERGAFEAAAGFQIDEDAADGTRVPAGDRDEYLPVMAQSRFGEPKRPPGFDLASNSTFRLTAELARDSGEPKTALVPQPLATGNPSYLAFWPIFSGDDTPSTIADRRAALRGYVVGVYRVADILTAGIANTPDIPESIEFHLSSEMAEGVPSEGTERLVAAYSPSTKMIRAADAPLPIAKAEYRFTRSFSVRGQRWRLEFFFSPEAVAAERSIGPGAILAAGLMLTIALAAYVIRESRQMSVVRGLVDERTLELRQSNARLAQSNTTLEALIDASPYAIICIDAENRVLMWNAAAEKLFGYTPTEIVGQPYPLVLTEEYEQFERRLERIVDGEVLRAAASRRRHKNGTIIETESSAAAFRDGEGVLLGVVFVIEDMRERNLVQTQLRQAQKMEAIGQLTGGMAHDFNNLLSVIIGNLDILREARSEDSEVADLSGEALDAAVRGADLTRRLLAFARRQPLQPQRIDLNSLAANVVRLLSRLIGENIEISLDLAPDLCGALADPAQLEAALTNLATNARDAMPRGGKLMIATGNRFLDAEYAAANPDVVAGDYALIEITDTGTGMPPEVLSHIFEPFYTTKDREQGTGLGLSMVFGFLKQSGGHITVYSEVGVGTTFRLYLPCAAELGEGGGTVANAAIAMGRDEKVLVVEDNAPLRRIVCRQLRALNYRVIEAGNAKDGLALLEGEAVDLLMTDVIMPGGMDGFGLARIATARWPGLKVLLTSGFPGAKLAEISPSMSFRLLIKPYRKEDLALMMREVLDI
jgi:PAS domain S-box-containing protein